MHRELVKQFPIFIKGMSKVLFMKNMMSIPIWKRYLLTIEEAAEYYHIGENKIRFLIAENPTADFIINNGNRTLIKKARFENYLDKATVL